MASLINGGMVNSGHALVNGGLIRSAAPSTPPLSPLDWWDPDLGAFQNSAGTTPAVVNNDPVRRLNGQVGAIGNLGTTTDASRPLLQTSTVNGHSSLKFDGSDDHLFKDFTFNKPCTIVLAFKMNTWVNSHGILSCAAASIVLLMLASTGDVRMNTTLANTTSSAIPGTGNWGIASLRTGVTSTSSLRINNNARLTCNDNTDPSSSIILGEYSGLYGAVEIGRVAVYNSALGTTDENTVVSNFMSYYGIP